MTTKKTPKTPAPKKETPKPMVIKPPAKLKIYKLELNENQVEVILQTLAKISAPYEVIAPVMTELSKQLKAQGAGVQ